MEKDKFTASVSNMKNEVDKASALNIEEDKASASDIDENVNKASASNMNEDDSFIIYSDDEERYTLQYICNRLEDKLTGWIPHQRWAECWVYRVPNSLRDTKPEAYTPQLISIGPLHHGDKRLVAMEELKIRYYGNFRTRNRMDKKNIMDLVRIILEIETYIRMCYSESHWEIESRDFIEMILLDAVFIIEFLKDSNDDRLLKKFDPRMIFCIREDLMLLENQLPFFVIEKIYDTVNLARHDTEGIPFLDIATLHFGKYPFTQGPESKQWIGGRHFTDLLRNFMLIGALKRSNCPNPTKMKYSAVVLGKAGVKFQASKDSCLVNIKFEHGVLKIPRLEIDDSFERFVRNVMAWEQIFKPYEAYICNYFKFMDHLIDSAEDVALLVEEEIIINWLGDDAAVSNLINNLSQRSEAFSYYSDICQSMNEHYENPWNHRKATLKLVYFSNLWRGTGTVAAAFLLILTLIQTITSVKSSFYD